ncbi:MAG: His/Gly/Thr/Pro-type tRNA ligase C-terminal domain-containing protein, partial [Reyranella sp.]|nr:His/Gly/Thr/Pro-type tRNA ligase C-terminal domain-containing protein [Reyranella sp.]
IGAQGTVLGGGRYDGLIAELGGPPTAGIGWAGGIERLMMLADEPTPLPRPVVIAPLGAAAAARALGLARSLRKQGIVIEQDYRGNMKRRMQRANKLNARAALIIGDDELTKGVAQLKDLDSGTQREVPFETLAEALKV